ncbi:hypothetical protein [Humisphaera borealis]|uniref:Uncharacterized protein n=1 Tax=Humisphaera borealis TaxID=2807512 RepID=A0A7M2WV64_9BACT|nr:hypothetical protein [Humisphaera borealis]QOV89447.1 hypothetical protein IPV69_25155 [Humisphaera borealis]
MDIEEIRRYRRAEPFRAFNLVLADGRKLPVDRPNALAIAPDGKLLAFQTLDSWFERIRPEAVAAIDLNVNTLEVNRNRLLATASASSGRRV